MSQLQRRRSLRNRIMAEEREDATQRANDTGLTYNCRIRRRTYGNQHEPCKAPPDDQIGVTCMCPCHDDAVGR